MASLPRIAVPFGLYHTYASVCSQLGEDSIPISGAPIHVRELSCRITHARLISALVTPEVTTMTGSDQGPDVVLLHVKKVCNGSGGLALHC